MVYNPRGFISGGFRPLLAHWKKISLNPDYRQLQLQQLRLKGTRRFTPFKTKLWGKAWCGPDYASFLSAFDEIFVNQIYDFVPERENPLILDCGANIGVSTLFFLKRFPHARLRAFEADPLVFQYLQTNVDHWTAGEACDVTLDNRAVFTHYDGVCFSSDGADAGHIEQNISANLQRIKSFRLKDILDVPVDFLKLDVEGSEYEILADCASELRNVRQCFVELHGRPSTPSRFGEAIGILESAGFRMQIHVCHAQRRPYRERTLNAGMDLQLNVFGVRP